MSVIANPEGTTGDVDIVKATELALLKASIIKLRLSAKQGISDRTVLRLVTLQKELELRDALQRFIELEEKRKINEHMTGLLQKLESFQRLIKKIQSSKRSL